MTEVAPPPQLVGSQSYKYDINVRMGGVSLLFDPTIMN
jgi:hypothetical protein